MSAVELGSKGIIGAFYARLEQNPGMGWVNAISNYFDSSQELETYKWLGQAPAMREWVAGRNAKGLRSDGISIRNKLYESTMEVLLDEYRRDKTGQLLVRINEQADRAMAHWAKLLSVLIENGGAATCYDGQYFYDTDHAEGSSGTLANAITYNAGTPAAPTAAELEQAIMDGIGQFLALKDDQGEPLNENASQFLIMVPVNYWKAAGTALKAPVIVDGSASRTNMVAGNVGGFSLDLAVNPRLSSTDKFYLFRTDSETKALIRQEEEGLRVDAVAEGSELEFRERKHHYGISAIRGAGYGMWQRSVRVQLT